MNNNHYLIVYYRLGRMVIHLAYAAFIVLWLFPWISGKARSRLERSWNKGLMNILNVRIRLNGVVPELAMGNVMLIANHVSWLDIYVLNTVRPVRFVSKIEVSSWPVVGWLARKTGTFFIDRKKRHDTARVSNEISVLLENGGCVAVFPEGTTSDGSLMRHFHSSLLEPAVHSKGRIWPAAIRYEHADGSLNIAPAYIDEITFGESLKLIINQQTIYVKVEFLPPIDAMGKVRRELALEAQHAIASALDLKVEPRMPAITG